MVHKSSDFNNVHVVVAMVLVALALDPDIAIELRKVKARWNRI
jgi:hypothetical protein